jgi:hypothetical protein
VDPNVGAVVDPNVGAVVGVLNPPRLDGLDDVKSKMFEPNESFDVYIGILFVLLNF